MQVGYLKAVASDGLEVAFRDLGGRGRPVLMAHATGLCGAVFAPLASHMAGWARSWAVDLRGHGDSGRPPDGDFDWRHFAYDVLACVDTLGSEAFVGATGGWLGVGHSCGGAALLLAELARPGTFSALYCYEPIALPASWAELEAGDPMSAGALRRRAVFESKAEAYRNFASKPPLCELHPDALHAYVEHGFADLDDGAVMLKCRPEDEARVFSHAARSGLYERLGEVRAEVTVAGGERSDAPVLVHDVAAHLARGRVEVLGGLGHLGPLEDPAAVATRVRLALAPRSAGL